MGGRPDPFQIGELAPYTAEVVDELGAKIASTIASTFESQIEDLVDRRVQHNLSPKTMVDAEISRRLNEGLLEDRLEVLVKTRLNDKFLLKHIDIELRKRVDVLLNRRLADDRLKMHIDAVVERRLTDNLIEKQLSKLISKKLDADFDMKANTALDRYVKVSVSDDRIEAALTRRFQDTMSVKQSAEDLEQNADKKLQAPIVYATPPRTEFIPFEPDKESSSLYELRLNLLLKNAGVTQDGDKKRVFLVSASSEVQAFLAAALFPRNISDEGVTFNDVVAAYMRMVLDQEERRSAYANFRRSEQGGRSVSCWLEELRRLAWRCRFRTKAETFAEIKKQVIRGSRLKDLLQEDDSRPLFEVVKVLEDHLSEDRRRVRPHNRKGNQERYRIPSKRR